MFKDINSFHRFKKYCQRLKSEEECAPKPAVVDSLEPDEKAYKQMPPKCWIYNIHDQEEAKSRRSKLHDLSVFEVDPLETVIGFYSVVGRRSQAEDEDSVSHGASPRVAL